MWQTRLVNLSVSLFATLLNVALVGGGILRRHPDLRFTLPCVGECFHSMTPQYIVADITSGIQRNLKPKELLRLNDNAIVVHDVDSYLHYFAFNKKFTNDCSYT